MTQQGSRRNSAWFAAAILIAVALLAPQWPGARIALSNGSVEIGRGEPPVWTPGEAGDALGAGDRVRTGADGRAEVALDGATLRLYPNSLLKLPAAAPQGASAVELEEGTSLFDVLRRGNPFEVRTPEVVVSVKGTRFGVAVGDDDASVSVFRGLVGVRSAASAAAETLVHPGFVAFGSERIELTWHGGDDPWEDWSDGDFDASWLRGAHREAALQDARLAALDLAGTLTPPASRDPGGEEPRIDTDETQGGPLTSLRDGVADALADTRNTIGEEIVEDLVDGPNGPPGGLLDVLFMSGQGNPGPDRAQVTDLAGGVVWTFRENDLEDVVDGDDSLPANLQAILQAQGIQDLVFANQLLSLFPNGGGGDDDDDDDD